MVATYLNPNATHELYDALVLLVGTLGWIDSFAKLDAYTKARCGLAENMTVAHKVIKLAKTKPAPPPGHHEQYLSLVVAHYQPDPPPKVIKMEPSKRTFQRQNKQRRIA